MTNKKLILSAAILSFIITASAFSYVRAADSDPSTPLQAKSGSARGRQQLFKNSKQRNHAMSEIRKAIEANDYATWAKLMQERPHQDVMISPETFEKVKEMHQLRQAGDIAGAQQIAEELGMKRFGDKQQARQLMQQARQAIEANDYNAWAAIMSQDPKFSGKVDEATFQRMMNRHSRRGDQKPLNAPIQITP